MQSIKLQNGFTIIELMVSMVIGLFLLAGVFTIYLSNAQIQKVVENEVGMMGDARFAIETIAYDLRQAGGYGHQNHENKAKVFDKEKFIAISNQCGGGNSGWAVNLDAPVFATDDTSDYISDCMADYLQGDALEIRYANALPAATVEANLVSNRLYLKSDPAFTYMFRGDTPPPAFNFKDSTDIRYYTWNSKAYYIAKYTDAPGDGIPSLRVVTLDPGQIVNDNILLRGVEDLQIKFGLDTPGIGGVQGDESADTYVNPDPLEMKGRWNQVISARIWLVLRSEKTMEEVDPNKVYEVAGADKVYGDKFRRIVVSTTIRLRNMNTGD